MGIRIVQIAIYTVREMSGFNQFFKREHIKCIGHGAAQLFVNVAGVALFLQLANNQSAPGSACI